MSIYKSKTWIEDIDSVLDMNPGIEELAGSTVMITGIGGLVCSSIADILIRYNEKHCKPITIIAAARSGQRIADRFADYAKRDYFKFEEYDATKPVLGFSRSADYIIHGASNSSPDRITNEPVETIMSNVLGTKVLLDFARNVGIRRFLYISSSEIYGTKEGNESYRENQYGYVDLLKSRSGYSVGKRAAETLCVSYYEEYGVDSVIVRPGHIYGPATTGNDTHISSLWANEAAHGNNIVMKSTGAQLRSYCHCLDTASAILTVLIKGETSHAYNISNPESVISIKQMAEMLASSADVDLKMELPTEEEKKSFNPMSNSSLDSEALQSLGWKGCFNAQRGFEHTIRVIREME